MIFGSVPVREAAGAILAHSARIEDGVLRKGTLLDEGHVKALISNEVEQVIVARLEDGDVGEDAAAAELAAALAGAHVVAEPAATGRSNLHAVMPGLFMVDAEAVNAINGIDPAITLATRPPLRAVESGRMVATVKIIPFAVPRIKLDEAVARARGGVLSITPFQVSRIGVVSTLLPSLKTSVVDKTLAALEGRLKMSGALVVAERRVGHDALSVATALKELYDTGAELLIAFGASAVADEDDVIPEAIRLAGGRIEHIGMPVDPGNLLIVGELQGRPVIGAPGCARSPRENGFDWVLERLLAGQKIGRSELTAMGVGGLLMDIVTRPRPREGAEPLADARKPNVAALILAAGRSTRMGGANKLLATLEGKPVVHHAVDAAKASHASSVTVVTGHMADAVEAALADTDVAFVRNPDYAKGLSNSLAAGIRTVPEDADGALVLLGDMPRVSSTIIDRLIAAFDPEAGALVVVPTFEGKRGNPVLWSRRFFSDLLAVEGDVGARHLIGANQEAVVTVEIGSEVAIDLDTPEELAAQGGTFT